MKNTAPLAETITATPVGIGLAGSLRRVAARAAHTELYDAVPPSGDWVRCAQALADPEFFDRWRSRLGDWLQAEYGHAPARSTAGYVLSWYAHVPASIAALLFHHERRVPRLHPGELSFRLGAARPHPDAIALTGSTFACLPDDPAAGLPEATVVPSERALAAVLRGRYLAHVRRFIGVFGPGVRFGRRTLWAAATDALDTALWQAGLTSGDEGAGVADATLVLADRFAPFTSASTLRPLPGGSAGTGSGEQAWTRRREGCCFHYLVEPGPAGVCDTCPRRHAP
ncbi:(2Fe-2S)-binding protein [Tamaricihabitans halophyticus]|nr:(2Fe-2S)-binding protein [Tamaricihabitans halophyticus]